MSFNTRMKALTLWYWVIRADVMETRATTMRKRILAVEDEPYCPLKQMVCWSVCCDGCPDHIFIIIHGQTNVVRLLAWHQPSIYIYTSPAQHRAQSQIAISWTFRLLFTWVQVSPLKSFQYVIHIEQNNWLLFSLSFNDKSNNPFHVKTSEGGGELCATCWRPDQFWPKPTETE